MYGVVWPWSAHIVGIALGLNTSLPCHASLLPPRLSCPSLLASEPAALVLLPPRLSRPSLLASVPAALVLLPPEMDALLAPTLCRNGACVAAGPALLEGEPGCRPFAFRDELLATELLATEFFLLPPSFGIFSIGGALKLNAAPCEANVAPCESHACCVIYIPAASEAAPPPSGRP